MLFIGFTNMLMFCYSLWYMKLVYLYLVIMEVYLFTITYYLSMYDLFMSRMFQLYSSTCSFNTISDYYDLLCML